VISAVNIQQENLKYMYVKQREITPTSYFHIFLTNIMFTVYAYKKISIDRRTYISETVWGSLTKRILITVEFLWCTVALLIAFENNLSQNKTKKKLWSKTS
jgi:hypothetical protein